jgi:ornithine carbamoyltransferase
VRHLQTAPETAFAQLSSSQAQRVLEHARVLRLKGGHAEALLRGKNLGLMCADENSIEACLFRRAASGLGARVSHIRPLAPEGDPGLVRDTSRMLGRLYDAVECQGLPVLLVQAIRADAGVPVYDDFSSLREPAADLVRELLLDVDGDLPSLTLQALLLSTIP